MSHGRGYWHQNPNLLYQKSQQRHGGPSSIPVFTSTMRLKHMDGVPLPRHPIHGKAGAPWIADGKVGRQEEETALVLPAYKNHNTSHGDPTEIFYVPAVEVDLDGTLQDEESIGYFQWQVYNSLNTPGRTASQAVRILELLETRSIPMPVECLNRVLVLCKAEGSSASAVEMFRKHRAVANSTSYRLLADLARAEGSPDMAQLVVEGLRERKAKADSKMAASLVSAVFAKEAKRSTLSKQQKGKLLCEVLELYEAFSDLPPLPEKMRVAAMCWFARLECHPEAVKLYKGVAGKGVATLTAEVFDSLVTSVCEVDPEAMWSLMADMERCNVPLTSAHCIRIMDACYKKGNLKLGRKVYHDHADSLDITTQAKYVVLEGKFGPLADPPTTLKQLEERWEGITTSHPNWREEIPPDLLTCIYRHLLSLALGKHSTEDLEHALTVIKQQYDNNINDSATLAVLLQAISAHHYTPPRRGDRQGWGPTNMLDRFRSLSADDWAFKAVSAGTEHANLAYAKWSRWLKDMFSRAKTAADKSKPSVEGDDAELALAALLDAVGEEDVSESASLFQPALVSEIMSGVSVLVIMDVSAAVAVFGDEESGYFKMLQALTSAQNQNKDSPQVRIVLPCSTLHVLHLTKPKTLATILKVYVSQDCNWLLLLPLSATFDLATDPYRHRMRKKRKLEYPNADDEPPPTFSNEGAQLLVLAERLQAAPDVGKRRVVIASEVATLREKAKERKVVPLSVEQLLGDEQ